jgi:hypothetical protein
MDTYRHESSNARQTPILLIQDGAFGTIIACVPYLPFRTDDSTLIIMLLAEAIYELKRPVRGSSLFVAQRLMLVVPEGRRAEALEGEECKGRVDRT